MQIPQGTPAKDSLALGYIGCLHAPENSYITESIHHDYIGGRSAWKCKEDKLGCCKKKKANGKGKHGQSRTFPFRYKHQLFRFSMLEQQVGEFIFWAMLAARVAWQLSALQEKEKVSCRKISKFCYFPPLVTPHFEDRPKDPKQHEN